MGIPLLIGGKLAKKTDPFGLIKKADIQQAKLKWTLKNTKGNNHLPFTKKWKATAKKIDAKIKQMEKEKLWKKYL